VNLRAQLNAAELYAAGPMHDAYVTDRDLIREVLADAGAPAAELDELVAMTPSVAEAMAYRPTQRIAWCVVCNAHREVDARGCAGCRKAIGASW
jgi:hypothetical protein